MCNFPTIIINTQLICHELPNTMKNAAIAGAYALPNLLSTSQVLYCHSDLVILKATSAGKVPTTFHMLHVPCTIRTLRITVDILNT